MLRLGLSVALSVVLSVAVAGCGGSTVPGNALADMASSSGCASDNQCGGAMPRCDKNSGKCVACFPLDDNCPMGQRCVAMNGTLQCTSSCSGDKDCPKSDAGVPVSCCGGACIDTSSDIHNCGGCDRKCPALANGASVCAGGICALGACSAGFANCDNVSTNGCEVNTQTDSNNCGTCATACTPGPHQSSSCVASVCFPTCAMGFSHCSMNSADGCEANTSTDIKNCGGCNKACPALPHMTPSCVAGQCGGRCDFGYDHCTMNPMDGCETSLLSPQNCGKCGRVCMAPPNASAGCQGGQCGIGACSMPWGDCDMNPNNGCEKDLSADLMNCGACRAMCAPANATPACLNGQCGVIGCNMGYADCDMKAANGCEVNTNTDSSNCGKCGSACPMNTPNCANGTCSVATRLLICYADPSPQVAQQIAAGINDQNQFSVVDIVDCSKTTPSLQTLQQYNAVFAWDDLQFADKFGLGDNLADYVDAGGGVVLAMFTFYNSFGQGWDLQGRWSTGNNGAGYNCMRAGNQGPANGLANMPNDPNSSLVKGVMTFSAQNVGTSGLNNGATSVWDYSNAQPAIAQCMPGGHKRVDVNFYPNPNNWKGDGYVIIRNALMFVSH